MKLITISGLDGSGKSTQLNLLKKSLAKKEFRIKSFHMISFSIANKILKQKKKNSSPEKKSRVTANKKTIFLRKIALIIDVFRFRHFYLMNSYRNKYDFILTDRYFYDQIVNIKFLEKHKNFQSNPFWQKIAEKYAVIPHYGFYLKINPEKILKRKRGVEQGAEYLSQKNAIFKYFANKWKLRLIDANLPKEKIHQKIIDLIPKK
jgi:dTMP kinase